MNGKFDPPGVRRPSCERVSPIQPRGGGWRAFPFGLLDESEAFFPCDEDGHLAGCERIFQTVSLECLRAAMGTNKPAANNASAASGGTNKRDHCQASQGSILAIGVGDDAMPTCAAEEPRAIPATSRSSLCGPLGALLQANCRDWSLLRRRSSRGTQLPPNFLATLKNLLSKISNEPGGDWRRG